MYALPSVTPDRTSPLITNLIGGAINVSYVLVFALNDRSEMSTETLRPSPLRPSPFRKKCLGLAVLSGVVFGFTFFVAPSHPGLVGLSSGKSGAEIKSEILGVICVLFNILMYSGPLTIMSLVITTKSVEFMPLFLTIGSALCSTTWLSYGLVVNDWNIVIPNGLGCLFAATQIILYITYANTKETKDARERVRREGREKADARDDDPLLYTKGTRSGNGV
jgi:hypothetical protein